MFSNINKTVLKNIPLIKTAFFKPSNILTKIKTEQNICTVHVCTFRSHFLAKKSFFQRTTSILTLSKAKYSNSSNSSEIKQNKFLQFSVKDNRKNVFISFVIIASCTAGIYVSYKLKKQSLKKVVEEVKEDKPNRFPLTSDEIPNHVPYLLIGGGTASFSAFRAIKSSDPTAKVLVISNEVNYPYMRPPLSKEIWFNEDRELMKNLKFKQWNGSERSLFYEPEDFYVDCKELLNMTNGGIAVARGWTVIKLDPTKRVAYLDDNKEITYDKCLIATGARPKNLNMFEKAHDKIKQKVTLFRTVDDFENLEEVCNNIKNVSVIGGGFLGSEISCALARYGRNKGLKVKQIFREKGNMAKVLPGYLSEWTTKKIEQEGVEILTNTNIDNVHLDPTTNQLHLILNDGTKIETDHVIVAVGVTPNTHLAQTSGLEIDPILGGFLVNAELEARSNLYAAGDCACFYDVKLGRRRVEHHDHAVVSGRLAGENMAGAKKPFTHQSMFWSDLGPEIGYEAIGIIDSNLSTMSVFAKTAEHNSSSNTTIENRSTEGELENKEAQQQMDTSIQVHPSIPHHKQDGIDSDYSKGIIFYLQNNIIVGIILWNVFNRMSTARQVIKEHTAFDDLTEVAKLFNIYDE